MSFGVKVGASGAVVQVFIVRGGRVIERVEFVWDAAESGESEADVIEAAIQQFYSDHEPPPEIHVPVAPPRQQLLEDWLAQKAERKVRIVIPQRGTKKGMMELAHRNAALAYRQRFDANATANYEALESLQAALRLPKLPRRIDCFDISTIQGSETVASMVVCEEGRMRPCEYRNSRSRPKDFKASEPQGLKTSRPRDQGSSMISRPWSKSCGGATRKVLENGGPFPDLIVIDGGKGQLNAAYAALETVGLSNLWRWVWRRKRSWCSRATAWSRSRSIRTATRCGCCSAFATRRTALRSRSTASRAQKRDLQSELDVVPGIGLRRRKTLLTAFGSLSGVRRATREELASVVGAEGCRSGDRALRRQPMIELELGEGLN